MYLCTLSGVLKCLKIIKSILEEDKYLYTLVDGKSEILIQYICILLFLNSPTQVSHNLDFKYCIEMMCIDQWLGCIFTTL